MGLIWVLVYAGSILPFFYFKSGIIDPWFNLFIFLGIYFAVKYFQAASLKPQAASHKSQAAITKSSNPPIPQSPNLPIFLSGIFIGLAILTKGPVAFLIFGITGFVYLITSLITSKLQNLKSSNPQILKSSNPPIPQSPNPNSLASAAGFFAAPLAAQSCIRFDFFL
jgi:4-amino-4-deoxy-L-arabinose transferase-like glycosyltransferase